MKELDAAPLPSLGVVGTFSLGILRNPRVRVFLRAHRVVYLPTHRGAVDAVVGWGKKPNTARASRFAEAHDLPLLRLEDGFVRSVGLGVDGDPALSMVIDDEGIFYDAHGPSRVETLIKRRTLSEAQRSRAEAAVAQIRDARLSKYNHTPSEVLRLPSRSARVLVVDQTLGDMSLAMGGVDGPLHPMLEAALDEHPDAEVVVKTHPDVLSGKRASCLPNLARYRSDARVRVVAESCNPHDLFEQVEHVYVATSQMGLEALFWGRAVTCFGQPFYAGWGLTDDRHPALTKEVARRRGEASLAQVFHAAYLDYTRYVTPDGSDRCELESVLEHLTLQRSVFARNAGHYVCVQVPRWRRSVMSSYLRTPQGEPSFVSRDDSMRPSEQDTKVLIWGRVGEERAQALAQRWRAPLHRMEDGFLRSVGLGSDFTLPASLVIDTRGIYYDPRVPSDLEHMLVHDDFPEAELERARALRLAILASRVSKYNVGAEPLRLTGRRPEQRVALVPGQVEDDASIRCGTVDICTNEALLRAARAARPDAYIIYKPHPDVVSGNRQGQVHRASEIADLVVEDAKLADCLDVADEVHTMTSLVGFEALLRELAVHVYGLPFYAGWGLTQDRYPHARRTRSRTLDELVAATLIRYPRYMDPRHGFFVTPEDVVALLSEQTRGQSTTVHKPRVQRLIEKGVRLAWRMWRAG